MTNEFENENPSKRRKILDHEKMNINVDNLKIPEKVHMFFNNDLIANEQIKFRQ